jgi:hypothetical protein
MEGTMKRSNVRSFVGTANLWADFQVAFDAHVELREKIALFRQHHSKQRTRVDLLREMLRSEGYDPDKLNVGGD